MNIKSNNNERYRRIDKSWHGILAVKGIRLDGKRYLCVKWDDGILTREPIHNHGDIVLHDEPMEFIREWPG